MAADKPDVPKGGNPAVAPAALLLAEIERLKAVLNQAEWKIAELEARSDIDPLLDILNRRGFDRKLARSLAYVKRYATAAALVFIDLDSFKSVNDQHGNAAGDALLRAVVARLKAHVRASDVVARLGGDEFAVLMWNLLAAPAAANARELENIIAQVTRRASRGAIREQAHRLEWRQLTASGLRSNVRFGSMLSKKSATSIEHVIIESRRKAFRIDIALSAHPLNQCCAQNP